IVTNIDINTEHLSDRLNSSSIYFAEKLDLLMSSLKKSPATTDSKTNAKVYDEAISTIFSEAALKKYLICATHQNFSVDLYYQSRNEFKMPDFNVKSYSKSKTSVQLKSNHPDLLNELVQ